MKKTELDKSLENDPLALRLSRIEDPPVSQELIDRVLSGKRPLRRRRVRRRHVAVAAVALAALTAGLVATPIGAAGRGLLQNFGIMPGAPQILQHPGPNDCAIYAGAPNTTTRTFTKNGVTITEWSRPAPKGCKGYGGTLRSWSFKPPIYDVPRAQSLVSFPIRTPSTLPPGLQLVGVSVLPKPPDFSTYEDQARVIYRPPGDSSGPNLTVVEQPGTPNGGSGVPSSSVKRITVNGHPAVYTHGTYDQPDPQGPAVWNPNGDVSELAWQADGITFDITAYHLHLSRPDLIKVAESVS